MSWILLTKKLPSAVSPPRFSIHWGIEWGVSNSLSSQQKRIKQFRLERNGDRMVSLDDMLHGYEGDEENALAILYKGERIKVYPHECNYLSPESMRNYVFGIEGDNIISHDLEPSSDAGSLLLKTATETALKDVMDAAILDGCSYFQALAVLMGMDTEDASSEVPPVGWFRCKPQIALVYCDESELTE